MRYIIALITLLITTGGVTAQVNTQYLLTNGISEVTIVLPADAGKYTKLATADLVRCLGKTLGAEIPTAKTLGEVKTPYSILIGDSFGIDFGLDTSKLDRDGCAIKTHGKSILITGSTDYGIANGVYTFLTDYVGVRWFAPGELYEVIPYKPTMLLPQADLVKNPDFTYRLYSGVMGNDGTSWQLRNRLTVDRTNLPYFGFGHNLKNIFPPSLYGKDHPEYYAMINGNRVVPGSDTEEGAQPCFTNPEAIKIAAEAADEFFRKNPTLTTFSLCVNDNTLFCECPNCSALDLPERKSKSGWKVYSNSYFNFVSEVAKLVAKTNPGKYLGCYAYWGVELTPTNIETLPDNVVIALTQETSQYFDPDYKKADRDLWLAWSKVAAHLGKYDYYGLGWLTPRFFPTQAAEDIQFIKANNGAGFYVEVYPNWSVTAPQLYLASRMLWDSSISSDAALNDYYTTLYGAAAPEMKKFYSTLEKYWTQPRKGQWFQGLDNIRPELAIADSDTIEDAWQCLFRAKQTVIGPELQRVIDVEDHFKFTYLIVKAYSLSRTVADWKITGREDLALMIGESLKAFEMVRLAEKAHEEKWAADPLYAHTYYQGDRFNMKFWPWEDEVRAGVQVGLLKVSDYCRTKLPSEGDVVWQDLRSRLLSDPTAKQFKILDSLEPRLDCVRAPSPIKIDGDLADWKDIPQIKFDPDRWAKDSGSVSTSDKGFFKITWDDKYFYFGCEVTDSQHRQALDNDQIWQQDSVQIGFDPRLDALSNVGYGEDDTELGFALSANGSKVWRWQAPKGLKSGKVEDIPLAVRSEGGKTTYEVAIPWSQLAFPKVADSAKFAFSVMVNDIDQNTTRAYLEWGGGIARSKDPRQFVPVRLKAE